MALEIERRFHVPAVMILDLPSEQIRQGYLTLPSDSLVMRVRAVQNFDEGAAANQGVITIKKFVSQGINKEFEYFIDYSEAEELLKECQGLIIHKTRYFDYVKNSDLCWEIDVFRNELKGVVIAEIELPSLDTNIEIPAYCGNEITHLRGVSNFNLAFHSEKAKNILRNL